MHKIKNCLWTLPAILVWIGTSYDAKSQGADPEPSSTGAQVGIDPFAEKLMDAALGKDMEDSSLAVYFKAVGLGLAEPEALFLLPPEATINDAYLILDGRKMEMKLGPVKALSDGKLMVWVDDVSRLMYVDSVDRYSQGFTEEEQEAQWISLMEDMGDATMQYLGTETLAGISCHKIKISVEAEEDRYAYHWIRERDGALFVMAEWQGTAYDVYLFEKIANAPEDHNYSVYLPNKEINAFYGYTVIDNRFIYQEMK